MDIEPKNLFFSIIIPSHNEEKYITQTLEHIKALDYPKDKLEVFVIENGSSDNTYFVAKNFENNIIKNVNKNTVLIATIIPPPIGVPFL